jgi:hypothetical protein
MYLLTLGYLKGDKEQKSTDKIREEEEKEKNVTI